MTMLVIGRDGQLAQAMARDAADAPARLRFAGRDEADLADRASLERAAATAAPRLIVVAAGYTQVDRAESDADAAFAANEAGPANLAAIARERGIPLIHISTDYVFDGTKTTPYVESDTPNPLGTYGRSKYAGERAVLASGARAVVLRTSWLYDRQGNNFVRTVLRLGREQPELHIVDDQHGCPTSARQLTEAVFAVARRLLGDDRAPTGVFHCSGAGATTWYAFAQAIFDLARPWYGAPPKLTPIASAEYRTEAQRPQNVVLDCAALAAAFGTRPGPWREELARTLDIVGREQACTAAARGHA